MQEGNHLTVGGRTDGVGVKDTGNSYGYAMRIESAATTDSPQSFDTTWSRQTWDRRVLPRFGTILTSHRSA